MVVAAVAVAEVAALGHRSELGGDLVLAVHQVGRAHQRRRVAEHRKRVEHQYATAQPVGPDLEAGAIARERIEAHRPRRILMERRLLAIVLAVVDDDLEVPWPMREWHLVAVPDPLQVTLGADRAVRQPVALHRRTWIDTGGVLGLVLVDHDVALVVMGLVEQPGEHATRIAGIGDPARCAAAVEAGDVALVDGLPEHLAGGALSPALDAREQALDARAVTVHHVRHTTDDGSEFVVLPCAIAQLVRRHQILGARQEVDVGVAGVVIAR
jgi:hypothetical protein